MSTTLEPDSRVRFDDLTIVADGDSFIAGSTAQRTFIRVPAIGALVLEELAAGRSIAETERAAAENEPDGVDVMGFVEQLLEVGIASADERPAAPPELRRASWSSRISPRFARRLMSRTAWTLYGVALVFSIVLFVAQPALFPSFEDVFWYPDPAVCLGVVIVTSWLLGIYHELGHVLAARAAGVQAPVTISRRLYFVVLETDLSELWSRPRSERLKAFLAGLALDAVVLAVCLALRWLWSAGVIDYPPELFGYLGVIVLMQVISSAWQFLFFLRTDLYAVLITLLGCSNLYRVKRLTLKRRLWRLTADERRELADADARDVAVARWFGWTYAIGFAAATYVFFAVFIPTTAIAAAWTIGNLSVSPADGWRFWEALMLLGFTIAQGLLPLAVLLWERRRDRGGVR